MVAQVLHGLLEPGGVQVGRGRLGPQRRQQAHPKVDPLRRVLVAGADVHLGAAQRRQRHRLQAGERMLLGEQQRQRLQPDQPAGELLGGEWASEPFAAAERHVEPPGQQQLKRRAEAAVEASDQLGLGRALACGAQQPRRGVPLGEQVDQQRLVVVAKLLDGLVVESEQLAGAQQQALAFGGEHDPAGGAGEQADAELLLEPADVAA